MKIMFLRHAHAVERSEWVGDDMLRPLSQNGILICTKFLSKLSKTIKSQPKIISSEAIRAVETAKIASEYLDTEYFLSDKLNPDSDFLLSKELFCDNLLLVGHEPNFSLLINNISGATIKLKKSSFVELDYDMSLNKSIINTILSPKNILKSI